MTELEEFKAKFKIVCRKCGSENVVIDMEEPTPAYSEYTGGDSGHFSAGCNDCKQNDFYWHLPGG